MGHPVSIFRRNDFAENMVFSQIVLALGACLKTASCAKQLLLILILILSIFGFVAQATFPLLEMNAFHGYSINDITHLG